MLFGEKRAENVRQLLSSQERILNIYTHAHANIHTNTVGRASVEYVRPFRGAEAGGNRPAVFLESVRESCGVGALVFKCKREKLIWIWPGEDVKL